MAFLTVSKFEPSKIMFWFCKKSDILNFSKTITGRFSAFKYFAVNAYFRRKNFFEENIQNIKLLQKISTWENFCRKKRRYRKNNCNLKPKVENFEKYIFIRRPVAFVKTIHFSFSLQIFVFFFLKIWSKGLPKLSVSHSTGKIKMWNFLWGSTNFHRQNI